VVACPGEFQTQFASRRRGMAERFQQSRVKCKA
jgi:hypothetical protein